MADQSKWNRPYFQPSGRDAYVFYKVYGSFPEEPEVPRARYRCSGFPQGIEPYRLDPELHPDDFSFGLVDLLGWRLDEKGQKLAHAVRNAPQCLVLQGEIEDPSDLTYFRDVVGPVMALLDSGGLAVCDPLGVRWWTPDEWRSEVFDAEDFSPKRHVILLGDVDEDSGRHWLHTRGMIQFGRPDLSVPNIDPDLLPVGGNLIWRAVDYQALGAVVAWGDQIRLPSVPDHWRCFEEGSFEDPEFNNRHLYIGPPQLRHLTLPLDDIDLAELLANWAWLVDEPLEPFAITHFGDLLLTRENGNVVLLDTAFGMLRELADSRSEFEDALLLDESAQEWFLSDLAYSALDSGLELGPGLSLSWKVPPILGGELTPENVVVTSITVHHVFNSQIHEQAKDLPEGTPVRLVEG